MQDIEFEAWPKTPRLFRDITVTEKLDGTNGAIIVTEDGQVGAQSRNRLVAPGADNAGFAGWVKQNEEALAYQLGVGRHFGEWYGVGIQRGYGLNERRFALFNTRKWAGTEFETPGLEVVPVLYDGPFSEMAVDLALEHLRQFGSLASHGFMRPEGICVFHKASRQVFKVTCENDDQAKTQGVAA